MGRFKVGDKVACIDANGEPHLIPSGIYTVLETKEGACGSMITVVEPWTNYEYRFELVSAALPEVKKVRVFNHSYSIMGMSISSEQLSQLYKELKAYFED